MTNKREHQDFYQIPGSERKRHSNDDVLGPTDENKIIRFQIYLKDRFKKEKDELFEKMSSQLPTQRKYLSSEEFDSKYSAKKQDIDKVRAYVEENGLKVEEVNAAARKMTISGSIGSVNKAFNVTLQDHKDPSGHHIGREGAIYIPSALSDVINSVRGCYVICINCGLKTEVTNQLKFVNQEEGTENEFVLEPVKPLPYDQYYLQGCLQEPDRQLYTEHNIISAENKEFNIP